MSRKERRASSRCESSPVNNDRSKDRNWKPTLASAWHDNKMQARFGRVLTAMVTPFHSDGSLDLQGAQQLARYLTTEGG